jgi:hypothetical protein
MESGASGLRYADDIYAIALDAVSLTATAASEANSAEGSGVRVDGSDTYTQPVTSVLKANKGTIRFGVTARQDPANWASFGTGWDYLLDMYEDANNYLRVYFKAANTLAIAYNAQGGGATEATHDATGETWSATKKQLEVRYGGSGAILILDGATVATAAGAVAFAAAPTNDLNWGHRNDGARQFDGVIEPY